VCAVHVHYITQLMASCSHCPRRLSKLNNTQHATHGVLRRTTRQHPCSCMDLFVLYVRTARYVAHPNVSI
jgi:hypothetical protein